MKETDLYKKVADFIDPLGVCLHANSTVEGTLIELRKTEIADKISYLYVVDDEHKLVGIVPTRRLLFCKPEQKIQDIMDFSVIRIKNDQTLKDAMEIFANHNLLALPVVDKDNKLLGTIDVQMYMEESFDVADAQHRRDIFQLIGITIEEKKKFSLWKQYRLRMPWLFCNIFAGIICAIISRINEAVLAKFLLLAMFIPLVLTLSESTSMQSMTQSLQFLRRPRFSWKIALSMAFKEWQVMLLIALSCGFLVGGVSLFWGDGLIASLTISIGILIGVTTSISFGIMMPIVLHTTRLDPKVASGPVVLMFADVITTLIYLSIASWWLL
jgi:magnesium transporter